MSTSTPTRRTPKESTPEYVLGTDQSETDRLGLQHRLWSAAAHNLWERASIAPGQHVLDVGCGPGHATMDLAELVGPRGRVVGVDESPLFLKQLHERVQARHLANVERYLGDIQSLPEIFPEDHDSFDIAYARWVLCFVKNPESVIAGVARLLKPGGRFAIQDYFNYEAMSIAPRQPAFTRVINAVGKSWRDRGGDPDIVARIPALCRAHGLEVKHLTVHDRIARPPAANVGSTIWHWPDSFFKNFVPKLVEMNYLTREEAKAFEAVWSDAAANPDCFMFLPPVFDLIAVKN
jgi:SAM-dependent methyltransferase